MMKNIKIKIKKIERKREVMNDSMYWHLRSLTIDKEMDIERDRLMHKSYLEVIKENQKKKVKKDGEDE